MHCTHFLFLPSLRTETCWSWGTGWFGGSLFNLWFHFRYGKPWISCCARSSANLVFCALIQRVLIQEHKHYQTDTLKRNETMYVYHFFLSATQNNKRTMLVSTIHTAHVSGVNILNSQLSIFTFCLLWMQGTGLESSSGKTLVERKATSHLLYHLVTTT